MGRRPGLWFVATAGIVLATTATLLPGPTTSARHLTLGAVPRVSVPVSVSTNKPHVVAHSPDAKPVRPAPTKTVAQPALAPAAPADLVREVHVMYARDRRASGDPQPSSSAPCPRATTCRTYQLMVPRWPTDTTGRAVIPFAYSDEGRRRARAPDGLMEPALQAAMAQWSHWNSNVVFQRGGDAGATFGADGKDGSCDDGTNLITWARLDPGVIGIASTCYDRTGKIIRDADLALNAAQHWERINGTPQSRHSYDIQSILTHELGHWLALEDLYSAESNRLTMHGETSYGETRKRTPALGDIIGVQAAYPCREGDSCPRSGIVDD